MRATTLLLMLLSSSCAWASAPSELISGPAGLTATQTAGVLWHRVEIRNGDEVLLSKRLRTRDRGGRWDAVLNGQPVKVVCNTVNGYSLELDCTMYGARLIGAINLPYDSPAVVTNGPAHLSAERIPHAMKEQIRIDWRGETVMEGTLWFRDGEETLKGKIDGQRVQSRCETSNDFMRIIDCNVYTTGNQDVVAQLRVPLF